MSNEKFEHNKKNTTYFESETISACHYSAV